MSYVSGVSPRLRDVQLLNGRLPARLTTVTNLLLYVVFVLAVVSHLLHFLLLFFKLSVVCFELFLQPTCRWVTIVSDVSIIRNFQLN